MAVGQALLAEQFKPMIRDRIQRCALTGHAVHTAFTLPDTFKSRDPVADYHNRQWRIRGHIIAFVGNQAAAISFGEPVN